jgi:hypothetical protein
MQENLLRDVWDAVAGEVPYRAISRRLQSSVCCDAQPMPATLSEDAFSHPFQEK